MSLTSERVMVKRAESGGDEQEVWAWRGGDGSLVVEERLAGETSLDIYEEPTHMHRVSVSAEQLDALAARLACPLPDVPARISLFLEQPDAFLADLMDLLDGLGVAYAYTATVTEGVIAFRPETSG